MRPLQPPPQPENFAEKVTRPSQIWLKSHSDTEPSKYKDFWNNVREDVQEAFDGCCAYLGMPAHSGHIDHFLPKSRCPKHVYEWSNFRWSEPRVNMLKGEQYFLDPFKIKPGWITVNPGTLKFHVTQNLPDNLKDLANKTLDVLNDRELVDGRKRIMKGGRGVDGEWDITYVKSNFPLLYDVLVSTRIENETLRLSSNGSPSSPVNSPCSPSHATKD